MNIEVYETYINSTQRVQFGSTDRFVPSYATSPGELFRDCQKEYGACISRMYRDTRTLVQRGRVAFGVIVPDTYKYETVPVGWVFRKRMRYEDARPCYGRYREQDYYIRDVWVEWREAPASEECCCVYRADPTVTLQGQRLEPVFRDGDPL